MTTTTLRRSLAGLGRESWSDYSLVDIGIANKR